MVFCTIYNTALAWSAVSVFLPLISGSFSQDTALVKGFVTIGDVQLYWKNCEDVYLRSTSSEHYQKLVEPLSIVYSTMLEYELRAICHLSKKQLSRAWNKLSGQDDWASKETEIIDASNKCKDYIIPLQRKAIGQNFLVEMQKLDRICQAGADIVETIRDEEQKGRELKMLKSLKSAAGEYLDGMEFNKDPVDGTCEWLYSDEKLSSWRDSAGSSVFWITAGPGCGKSVLARSLIVNGHLGSTKIAVDYGCSPTIQSTETMVCFFFFKDESKRRSSIRSAISAILHRLFSHRPGLARLSLPAFESTAGKTGTGDLCNLWNLLITSAKNAGSDIICVLDALDECNDPDRRSFIGWLDKLYADDAVSSSTHLKFLITSRPYHDIEKYFESQTRMQYFRFDADERHQEISHDISLVIDVKVAQFASGFNERDRHRIAQHLKSQGTNTYLWLHLTLGIIEGDPTEYSRRRDIEALLSDIPSQVSEAYEKILRRTKNEKRTSLLLQIILAASEPWSLDEANYALTLAEGYSDIESHAELKTRCWNTDFKTIVKSLCGLIINIYDDKLSFIHLTARDFLVRDKGSGSRMRKWGRRFADAALLQRVLARCCMQYLLLPDFSSRILCRFEIESGRYKFLRYASKNWPGHFQTLDDSAISSSLPQARQLCSTSLLPWYTWGRVYMSGGSVEHLFGHDSTDGWSDLAVASFAGLTTIVEDLLSDGADVNQVCKRYPSALHSAVERDQEHVGALLIANGAQVDKSSSSMGTPLDLAVTSRNQLAITKLLIENGASPLNRLSSCRRTSARTILSYAATLSSKDIFYAMLAGLFDLSTPQTIVAATKNQAIIDSGNDCLALVLDLLDDQSLGEIFTKETLTCLMSVSSTSERAFRLIRNTNWRSILIETSVLTQIEEFEGAQDVLQQVVLEGGLRNKKITDEILAIIAIYYDPETLRIFIKHSPENCDIKHLFSAAVCNRSHYNTVPSVVLEFAEAAISDDEKLQNDMLVGWETERWDEWVWHREHEERDNVETEQKIATVRALLNLPNHSNRIKKSMISAALICITNLSSPPLKHQADEPLNAVLNRFGHQDIFDADLLTTAAEYCDLRTLQLVFNYSSGMSMADEPILKAVAANDLHGRDIMKTLLQKYQSAAIITPALVRVAACFSENGVLALLVEMRCEEIEMTVDILVRVRERHVLNTIIEQKRDEVAPIASAALHEAAFSGCEHPDDVERLSNDLGAVEPLLNCCPSSWFEPTEELVLDLLDAREAATYITLLFEKLGDRVPLTERILLKVALSRSGYKLLQIFKLWKPQGLPVTPWLIKKLFAGGHVEELAAVIDSCDNPLQLVRDGPGSHIFLDNDSGEILGRDITDVPDLHG